MSFQVPYSSSPPSTPDSRRQQSPDKNPFAALTPNPSTTPAGPPPSSANSFTPAGPPPSSAFGSSIFGAAGRSSPPKPLFGGFGGFGDSQVQTQSPGLGQYSSVFDGRTKNGTPARPSAMRSGPKRQSPPLSNPASDGDDEDEAMRESEADTEGNEDVGLDRHDGNEMSFEIPGDGTFSPSSEESARGTKRSRNGDNIPQSGLANTQLSVVNPRQDALPGIVRDLSDKLGRAALREPDYILLGTQEQMEQLYDQIPTSNLTAVPEVLLKLWQSSAEPTFSDSEDSQGDIGGIGPNESAPSLSKAAFLSSLLLQIHHPPQAKATNTFSASRSARSFGLAQSFNARVAGRTLPIPKVLLDWLDANHNPYPSAIADLQSHRPNPSTHVNFWDIILSSVLRGKLEEALRVLKITDFGHVGRKGTRGSNEAEFLPAQLGNIRRVMTKMIQLLEQCPAIVNGDWDVRSSDWTLFRLRVSQSKADLTMFAEGGERDAQPDAAFEADNFGIRKRAANVFSMSEASRRAESKVPWAIYQNLKAIYDMLLGGSTEIISFSQDWAEAAIALTVWWDGEEASTRTGFDRSLTLGKSVGESVYPRRLAWALDRATADLNEDGFQINTMNPVEVGLASVMAGDVNGVIGLLRSWSLPLASAVVEIASWGGWYGNNHATSTMNGFDRSDLMVLSYGQPKKETDRDSVLIEYAEELFHRRRIDAGEDAHGLNIRLKRTRAEGWELGIQVLGRVDDTKLARTKVSELLDQLNVDSAEGVDKVLALCGDIGLADEARTIAERYADSIAESSYRYGEALLYYARAHQQRKLKSVLDLLMSFCIVQSMAYPSEAELDRHLKLLISSPKQTLTELSRVDFEAAEMLHLHLSGYATLRTFYNIRDGALDTDGGLNARTSSKKQRAAAALVATINSAEDNIHGGLYDENRDAVISVDGLLALLGEALMFVNQPKRVLSLAQAFDLLKAAEDLETVTPRVYAQCEEFFQSAVSSARGASSKGSSPRATLKKSISSMTASSSFSLVGSSAFRTGGGDSLESGSGVLVPAPTADVKRGWDWRQGLPREVTGRHVLRILRLGLSKEISRGWIAGEQ
ncbi:MAG: hypothetical protein M4579_002317 [Chaenotheca gracillima]|nr:MAG: hypothetical protein M4579_002317 [Chaenotheca gracillima]